MPRHDHHPANRSRHGPLCRLSAGRSARPPPAASRASSSSCCTALGADGNDLIGLAPYWAPLLPDAEFVSPNAPFPCDMAPYGYQWFSVQDRTPGGRARRGARRRADPRRLHRRRAARRAASTRRRLALVGFSQGTMMSLYVGLRRAKPLAGIVGYSGAADRRRSAGARRCARGRRSCWSTATPTGRAVRSRSPLAASGAEGGRRAGRDADLPRHRPRHRRGRAAARRRVPARGAGVVGRLTPAGAGRRLGRDSGFELSPASSGESHAGRALAAAARSVPSPSIRSSSAGRARRRRCPTALFGSR